MMDEADVWLWLGSDSLEAKHLRSTGLGVNLTVSITSASFSVSRRAYPREGRKRPCPGQGQSNSCHEQNLLLFGREFSYCHSVY